MSNDPQQFCPARTDWDRDGNPISSVYQDIYFSGNRALQESSHVFLTGNRLAERWHSLEGGSFIIGECGFGAGINFLNCCRLWHEISSSRPSPAACPTLHYLACELHPFQHDELKLFLQKFKELEPYSNSLLDHYPALVPGVHARNFRFQNARVRLVLLFGNAPDMLARIWQPQGVRVDAWFMDGFTPSKNPDMWSRKLCDQLARFSHATTTLSTYSAAGAVKRNLQAAGFTVSRKPGFEQKRHMLIATMPESRTTGQQYLKNCFNLPARQVRQRGTHKKAIVIGGGLAGCSSASALADSGWETILFEQANDIATQASGNDCGIVHCKVSAGSDAAAEFNHLSYLYALQHYQQLSRHHDIGWQQCGLLQLAQNPREQSRHNAFLQQNASAALAHQVDVNEAKHLSGLQLQTPALFFPQGAHLSPRALCQAYLRHVSITCRPHTQVTELHYANNSWHAYSGGKLLETADIVVIANSHDAARLTVCRHYPLTRNFGQIDRYNSDSADRRPSCIICSAAYLIPGPDGAQFIGGVSRHEHQPLPGSAQAAQANLELLDSMDPALKKVFEAGLETGKVPQSRSGWRCSSPDYLPLAGPVEKRDACAEIYADLRRNARQVIDHAPRYEPGLYLNIAHGAHGLSTTPLIADYLAALIDGAPLPLSNRVANAVHPIRFLIRQLKRQESGMA